MTKQIRNSCSRTIISLLREQRASSPAVSQSRTRPFVCRSSPTSMTHTPRRIFMKARRCIAVPARKPRCSTFNFHHQNRKLFPAKRASNAKCALRKSRAAHVTDGSWLCENFSARRERRIVRRNCAFSESNLTAHASHDLELENWIFYILRCMSFHTARVKTGRTHIEHMISALLHKADLRAAH